MTSEAFQTETGTTACPICGKTEPHWHHPQVLHVAQMIASSHGAGQMYSDFVARFLETAKGKSITALADEICTLLTKPAASGFNRGAKSNV